MRDVSREFRVTLQIKSTDTHLTALPIQILLMFAESANLAQKLMWFDEESGA